MHSMKYNHYFLTVGDQESGNYKVFEVINNVERELDIPVYGNHRDGLKEARQHIARYIMSLGYTPETFIPHYCRKPGREKDALNKWHASDYYELL